MNLYSNSDIATKNSPTLSQAPCGKHVPELDAGTQAASRTLLRNRLEVYIQKKNLKKSKVRTLAAELVLNYPGHFTVTHLLQFSAKQKNKIGPATLYRTIELLCDAGIIQKSLNHQATGETLYEVTPNSDHHDHIVCLDCDSIFEFHNAEIEAIQDRICNSFNFKVESHRHVLYARCTQLNSNSNNS